MAGSNLGHIEFHGEAKLDFDMVGFVVVSSILATIALLARSVPVLIGAMILAPTFDPLIAIAFAVVTRDWALMRTALVSSIILFGTALLVCFATVAVMAATNGIPTGLEESGANMVTERLTVGLHAVVVALAAGAGGALASASNRRSNLVGVVVALALVPALAAAAIGFQEEGLVGWGGLALFGVNVGGIIVSGLFVLYLRFGVGKAEELSEENRRGPRRQG